MWSLGGRTQTNHRTKDCGSELAVDCATPTPPAPLPSTPTPSSRARIGGVVVFTQASLSALASASDAE